MGMPVIEVNKLNKSSMMNNSNKIVVGRLPNIYSHWRYERRKKENQNKTGIALHTDFKRNYSLRGRMDTDLRTYQAILHFSHNQFLAKLGGFLSACLLWFIIASRFTKRQKSFALNRFPYCFSVVLFLLKLWKFFYFLVSPLMD